MELEIKTLSSTDTNDFVELIKIFGDVFEMQDLKIPDNSYLESLLKNKDFLVLTAKSDNKVIGGLTVYILHRYYSVRPIAYIYDVGVLREYQRKGVGKMLIEHFTDYCKKNGFEETYVEAESDDIQAVNFYRSTSISHELQATHFTYLFDSVEKDNGE